MINNLEQWPSGQELVQSGANAIGCFPSSRTEPRKVTPIRLILVREHGHHFPDVDAQFFQGLALGMGSREAGDVTHEKASLHAVFNHDREGFHDSAPGRWIQGG